MIVVAYVLACLAGLGYLSRWEIHRWERRFPAVAISYLIVKITADASRFVDAMHRFQAAGIRAEVAQRRLNAAFLASGRSIEESLRRANPVPPSAGYSFSWDDEEVPDRIDAHRYAWGSLVRKPAADDPIVGPTF